MGGLEDLTMLSLAVGPGREALRVLCIGAHADDIEIGCAGLLLKWLAEVPSVDITWVVMSAGSEREREARRSARALTRGAARLQLILGDFEDTRIGLDLARAQAFMHDVSGRCAPDVVLTHRLEDRHQDHRFIAELTWQTWRDHLILEYEIPKYEGDLGQPNLYVPLTAPVVRRKVQHLLRHFGTQSGKGWFVEATFRGLMALRGIECRSTSGLAEAFTMRKGVL